MRAVRLLYQLFYAIAALAFALCGLGMLAWAGAALVHGLSSPEGWSSAPAFKALLETIGVLTIAVATFELSQTVLEEEVLRNSHMSAPTRARRFLSRFLVVVVAGAAVEFLIAVFELLHGDQTRLVYAAAIGFATAALLAAWGVFVRLNRSAEELEPDALAKAKAEDDKVEG